LRIGVATAKGLCFALRVPLVLVSSLKTLAARGPAGALVLACIDAGRGQVYARLYAPESTPGPWAIPADLDEEAQWDPARLAERLAPLAGAAPLLLVGDGALAHPRLVVPGSAMVDADPGPDPVDLVRLGAGRLHRGEADDLALAVPNYICPSAPERAAQERAAKAPT
jgi:tRNA threonylcarbamoyladenosine biosynthesis protein TsaB